MSFVKFRVKSSNLKQTHKAFTRHCIKPNIWNAKYISTHLFPMHSSSTPWKHQKTVSWCFQGVEKGTNEQMGTNGLINVICPSELLQFLLLVKTVFDEYLYNANLL